MPLPSSERYRRLVERSPDGILVSRNGHLVLANDAAVELLNGAGPADLLGRPLLDLLDPDDRTRLELSLADAMAGAVTPPIVVQFIRPDGRSTHVELRAALLDAAEREFQIVVRDVTARTHADAALRENEERLTLAFAGAQEGVWDWNLETGAVVYSPRWKQMLGYGEDEIEPHVRAWERLLHPDDEPAARKVYETVIQGASSYEGEFRLRHKDGHYICVLSRGFPVRNEPGGPVVRIVGTHLDLTERKQAEAALRESEERLTLAFEGAQEGVWDWNLETGAVVYSARWKQMLGYGDDEVEPHISAWERLLHPDDMPRARQVHESVLAGAQTYEGEFRLRHKEGHYIHVLSRGFPVRRPHDGSVVRIVGTHFDLTERKQADAERARTELLTRLVFAQEDERRRIAREMHDQFGEQLTTLGVRIRMLKEACADSAELLAQADALEAVVQQLDRDVDSLVWELRPTALDDLGLRAALANYVQQWSRRVAITAELHTSGLLDERLSSETETTLYRIAQEALTNVAKHSRARHVEVILERRHDYVLLAVEDDGVGFDMDAGAGTQGFGLVGMHERASIVGATLEIESAPGSGTTILVRIAAAAPATHAADHA